MCYSVVEILFYIETLRDLLTDKTSIYQEKNRGQNLTQSRGKWYVNNIFFISLLARDKLDTACYIYHNNIG